MKIQIIQLLSATAAFAMIAQAQDVRRQATMVGGGGPDRGKCTIEVRVDQIAEVEIRGTMATIRTLQGQPSQFRRFECTAPLPANPANFRFAGVDGRGRQTLVRNPGRDGVAVVRIEDPDNGSEGYTFDIFWQAGGYAAPPPVVVVPQRRVEERRVEERPREYGEDRYRPGWREGGYFKRYGHGFPVDEAVRLCQDSVTQQARRRFRDAEIHFGPTRLEDGPGRNDWVSGVIDVHGRERDREMSFGFSCSVDFGEGRLRSTQIDDRPLERRMDRR